jgi:IS5 family transposase
MMKPRISLFAEHEREDRRTKIGDPLVGLTNHVDFDALAASIDAAAPRPSRAKGGRPPYSTLLMVKILVLQQLYNLADDALEYQLLDRRSFLQFLDLTESSSIPDAKTIWLFRDRLAQAGAGTLVFEQVQQQLQKHGYMARCGQIVDASLVQAPVQRNKRDEADTVKEGTMPLTWKPHKRAQKDVDARWTKKHGKSHFGYKLHASGTSVTNSSAKSPSPTPPWPTPPYSSLARSEQYQQSGVRRPRLPKRRARKRAQTGRLACPHPAPGPRHQRYFGRAEAAQPPHRHATRPRRACVRSAGADGRKLVRCLGIVRTTFALHLKAASYNLKRLVFLKERGLPPF